MAPVPCAAAPSASTSSQALLFVGDPHLTSQRIARRIDDYAAAVLDKLGQCVDLANAAQARMVILGDLFDRCRETNMALLCDLVAILKRCAQRPIVLAGNHDMAGTRLTEDTTLALLSLAGVADVIDETRTLALDGIDLLCVPYGQPMPRHMDRRAGTLGVAITHHDWAIEPNTVPAATPPFEVAGCDLVVNGHDHTHKPPMRVGATVYFNPGNIARVSVAQLHHVPRVHLLLPQEHVLPQPQAQGLFAPSLQTEVPVSLPGYRLLCFVLSARSGAEVFDLTGYAAQASTDEALAAYLADFARTSEERFIEALRCNSELQAAGGSGEMVASIVRQTMDDMNAKQAVRAIIEDALAAQAACYQDAQAQAAE
ncbi:MAG: metallophosphoesterase [Rhodocyclaceae bacterium]|nr:metallophosphoesterase [Rhodocyclaceae bacterium]